MSPAVATALGGLLLFGASQAYLGVWATLSAVLGRLTGHPVPEVALGAGPSAVVARFGTTRVRLGVVPLGGSVQVVHPDDADGPPPAYLALGPHAALGGLGAALASRADLATVGAVVAGWFGIGEIRVGLVHALVDAAAATAAHPLGAVACAWATLGALNVASGAALAVAGALARRGLTAALPLAITLQALLTVALLLRTLWLDL